MLFRETVNALQVMLVSEKILMAPKSSLLVLDKITVAGTEPLLERLINILTHRTWFARSVRAVK